jgi:hypothetical protein
VIVSPRAVLSRGNGQSIIVASGTMDRDRLATIGVTGKVEPLVKPFSAEQLLSGVARILSAT